MRGVRPTEAPDDFWIPIPLETNNITALSPYLVPQEHLGGSGLFYSLSAFMFVLFVSGTAINILTIACTVQYKKLRSHLNYILVNLAIANLVVSFFGSSTCFICFAFKYMILGPFGCKVEGFTATVGGEFGKKRRTVSLLAPVYGYNVYHSALLKIIPSFNTKYNIFAQNSSSSTQLCTLHI